MNELQNHQSPEAVDPARAQKLSGIAVILFILAVPLGVLVWDLYPALTNSYRLRQVEKIAALGSRWSQAKPILLAAGYTVSEGPEAVTTCVSTRRSRIGLWSTGNTLA